MANGDPALRDVVSCDYLDDFGNAHTRRVLSMYQTQAALGWDLNSNHSFTSAPRGLKPRTWLVQNASDHTQRARVVVATNADYYAGVMDTTTVVVPYRGYQLTMTLYGKEGERWRGRTMDNAVQASLPA